MDLLFVFAMVRRRHVCARRDASANRHTHIYILYLLFGSKLNVKMVIPCYNRADLPYGHMCHILLSQFAPLAEPSVDTTNRLGKTDANIILYFSCFRLLSVSSTKNRITNNSISFFFCLRLVRWLLGYCLSHGASSVECKWTIYADAYVHTSSMRYVRSLVGSPTTLPTLQLRHTVSQQLVVPLFSARITFATRMCCVLQFNLIEI